MGDNGTAGPPAKKRGASRQISKDDSSDSEGPGPASLETGSFQKASEEVLASRRIVKVRRSAASAAGATASAAPAAPNPFASIRLVASSTVPSTVSARDGAGSVLGKDSASEEASSKVEDAVKGGDVQGKAEEGRKPTEQNEKDVLKQDGDVVAQVKLDENATKKEGVDAAKGESGDASRNEDVNVSKGAVTDSSEGAKVEDKAENEKVEDQPGSVGSSDEGKEHKDEDAKQNGTSEKTNDAKDSSGETNNDSSKTSLPPAGTTATFSFGTAASSVETPGGFASFSSTWGSFSSGSGSGFAFKAAGEGEGTFNAQSTAPGSSNGSSFQLFGTSQSGGTAAPAQPSASVQFQEVVVQTGEEKEKTVFAADATLFEFMDASWKERGKGEVKVNVPEDKSAKPRLVMRAKGNYKLLMNAGLFPDMKLTSMDSRGVTFACINSVVEGKTGLTTYAVKFRDSLAAANFRDAVDAHKIASPEGLKTPENSPRAES